jgi:hypothetical protein
MEIKKSAQTLKEALFLFHQDGAVDVIAGATLLNFGFDVLGQAESTSLFTWIPILLLSSIKNKNTMPRLSPFLKEVSDRQLRTWTFVPSVMMILTLILLGILMLSDPLNLSQAVLPLAGDLRSFVGFTILALILLVPAFWVGLKQFFIYSAVAFAIAIASFFVLPAAWGVFLTAAVMLVLGGRNMLRFTRQYPLPDLQKPDEK